MEAKNNQLVQEEEKRIQNRLRLYKQPLGQLHIIGMPEGDIHITGMPEGEEKEQEIGNLFEKNNERKLP